MAHKAGSSGWEQGAALENEGGGGVLSLQTHWLTPHLLPPAAHTAEDTSDLLQYVKFQSSNFENILIWDGGPNSTPDTVYSVEYKRQVSHPNRPPHDPALQNPQLQMSHRDQVLLSYIQSEVQTVESGYSPCVRASSNHVALGSQGSLSFPIC